MRSFPLSAGTILAQDSHTGVACVNPTLRTPNIKHEVLEDLVHIRGYYVPSITST